MSNDKAETTKVSEVIEELEERAKKTCIKVDNCRSRINVLQQFFHLLNWSDEELVKEKINTYMDEVRDVFIEKQKST